jgi:hypothetical protein
MTGAPSPTSPTPLPAKRLMQPKLPPAPTAKRLRAAVLKALEQVHAMLNPDQRAKLAYLLRSGVLAI